MAEESLKPQVAVIILNWNGEKLLKEFLPSVVAHTNPEIGKVVVADNGSTDGSLSLLEKNFSSVEVLRFDKNHGYAGGYNLAIAHYASEYPYVVLLNSDVAVDGDWLSPLYRFMVEHDGVGACQPKILSYRNPSQFEYAGACGGFIDRNGYPYCRGRVFATLEEDCGQYDESMPIFWATGAALMIRSRLYLKVGGLDVDFFAHMEEIDLCWRTLLSGWQIYVVPQSHVYHLGGGSLDASNPRKTYLNFRNNLLMLHKNLPRNVGRRTLFWRRILDSIAWCKFVVAFDWKNAVAVLRAHRDFRRMRKKYVDFPSQDLLHTSPSRPNILIDYFLLRRLKWRR